MEIYRIVHVEPAVKNDVIKSLEMFGWRHKAATEETIGFYAKTDKQDYIQYISLLFVRNTKIKNCEKLNKLEIEYTSGIKLKEYVKKPRKPVVATVILSFIIFISFTALCTLFLGVIPEVWEIVLTSVLLFIAFMMLSFVWVRYAYMCRKEKKYNEEILNYNNAAINAWEKRIKDIEYECCLLRE